MASLSLLSALSVPVSADNKNFSFNLSTGQSSVTSTYSTKDDNEPQAYVNVKGEMYPKVIMCTLEFIVQKIHRQNMQLVAMQNPQERVK